MGRLVDAIVRYRAGVLGCEAAAELLGLSDRHFRRLRDRYEEDGPEGLIDRRRGRVSGSRAPLELTGWVLEQYRTRHYDFTAKHFHERLVADHGFQLGYTWTKLTLHAAGYIQPAPRRSAHRKKRVRRPLPGMMLFQDGSTHDWLAGQAPFDLIVTLDDATSAIYSAFLVEQEGIWSSFRGLAEVIERHGLFSSFYTDRGSHYFYTPKAGAKVSKDRLTEVGRALEQLGIEHIPSYCPEGRGRMERVFGTLQGRLPQELRLAGITELDAANRWLREVYVPRHNARFAVPAAEAGTAFVPFVGSLAEILCVRAERVVGHDNCVRYQGRSLQIGEQAHRRHFVKATVRVHEYADRTVAIFHGPRRIGRYAADGSPLIQERAA